MLEKNPTGMIGERAEPRGDLLDHGFAIVVVDCPDVDQLMNGVGGPGVPIKIENIFIWVWSQLYRKSREPVDPASITIP